MSYLHMDFVHEQLDIGSRHSVGKLIYGLMSKNIKLSKSGMWQPVAFQLLLDNSSPHPCWLGLMGVRI